MNEKTVQHIIELLEKQDERLLKLEELIAGQQQQLTLLPDYRTSVSTWNKQVAELNNSLKQLKLPVSELTELKKALSENTAVRMNPLEVKHHHYVPKVIIASCILLLCLALMAAGWYKTTGDLKQYKANDIQLRYLKLMKDTALNRLLYRTDNFYRHNPDGMRDSVIQREEDLKIRLELSQQAQEKESEAKRLREKAKRY